MPKQSHQRHRLNARALEVAALPAHRQAVGTLPGSMGELTPMPPQKGDGMDATHMSWPLKTWGTLRRLSAGLDWWLCVWALKIAVPYLLRTC